MLHIQYITLSAIAKHAFKAILILAATHWPFYMCHMLKLVIHIDLQPYYILTRIVCHFYSNTHSVFGQADGTT